MPLLCFKYLFFKLFHKYLKFYIELFLNKNIKQILCKIKFIAISFYCFLDNNLSIFTVLTLWQLCLLHNDACEIDRNDSKKNWKNWCENAKRIRERKRKNWMKIFVCVFPIKKNIYCENLQQIFNIIICATKRV